MLKTTFPALSAALLIVACAAPKKADVAAAPEIAVHLPNVTFSPEVWETAGSTFTPTLTMTTPPHNSPVIYSFHYEGDGQVDLPDPITLKPGETELTLEQPFKSYSVDEAVQGTVNVVWSHPETSSKVVGHWTVVQRPSILQTLRVARADSLVDSSEWDATFAISVELDPTEEGMDNAINDVRTPDFTASANAGDTELTIQTFENVTLDEFAAIPREVVPTGPHHLYVVCAKRPRVPTRQRPFLHITVRCGGDELDRFIKLPF
ncbi:MAG: hypothetical protein KDB61_08070 [Planctomycetes bacterium]|nr:hypothetical protein [Planctomycetota bacterium]